MNSFVRNAYTTGKMVRKIVLETIYFGLLVLIGGCLAFIALYFFGTPSVTDLPQLPLAQTSFILDRTGEHILYKLYGEENRRVLSHEEISDALRLATVAQEDGAFYDHFGVDMSAIGRALWVDIQAGKIEQGGSTITQQLARNAFLTRERTIRRKILETVLAVKIERSFSKDEILDMYLNRVPYGANAYGVSAAAATYFGKQAKDLTVDESALLASLTKAPSLYSPYVAKPESMIAGRNRIIERMNQLKFISSSQKRTALAEDTVSKITPFVSAIDAPHFVFYIIDQLERTYGRDALETGGWRIYTTLDWDMQQLAQQVVKKGAAHNIAQKASNAALTAIDPKTGEILAMVGSKDFFDTSIDGEVNVATRPRQPGSSFKPIAYATAFAKGFQPETILTDKRINFGPDGSGKDYIPSNYDGRYHGTLPMRSTLAQSLNIPAVQTLYLAGVQQTIDMAHTLGISTLNESNRYGLALVLGGGEVTLLDMVSAFGVFSQEGVRTPTHGILRILDQSQAFVYRDESQPQTVIDAEVARKISSILSDNVARTPIFGAHSPLILPDRPVAAKTGTTQNFRDAWTIGYTPSLAVGVWAGNNDNTPMRFGADGVFVAAPLWHDFMVAATKNMPVETFTPYTPVVSNKPLLTGKRDSSSLITQYFDTKSGKKLSAEKASQKDASRVRVSVTGGGGHSILYYVNKNDPLGPTPPDWKDPMLPRWEGGGLWNATSSFADPQASSSIASSPSPTIVSHIAPDGQIYVSAKEYYGKK